MKQAIVLIGSVLVSMAVVTDNIPIAESASKVANMFVSAKSILLKIRKLNLSLL